MIYESWYWKEELGVLKKDLENAVAAYNGMDEDRRAENFDKTIFQIERVFFYATIAMRRLIESDKMTDKIDNCQIHLTTYKPISGQKDECVYLIRPMEEYDFTTPYNETLNIKKLLSEILHGYAVYYEQNDPGEITEYHVSSTYNYKKRLLVLPLSQLLEIIDLFRKDFVSKIHTTFDVSGQRIQTKK